VVKSKRGRRRYIAFAAEGTTEDLLHALGSALRGAGVPTYKLIQYDGRKGIVRVRGEDQARAVEALGRPGPGLAIRTLAVSGTLKTLRERFFAGEGR